MKRCPKCGRKYDDDSLNYCLQDGSSLITAPESEQTLVTSRMAAPTIPSWVGNTASEARPRSSLRAISFAAIVLLAVILGGGGVALLYRINNWNSKIGTPQPTPTEAAPVTKAKDKTSSRSESTPERTRNISGEWNLVNTIEQT